MLCRFNEGGIIMERETAMYLTAMTLMYSSLNDKMYALDKSFNSDTNFNNFINYSMSHRAFVKRYKKRGRRQ